ncbi:MAG: hypothetical protein EOO38_09755 [Cytophagaceae bacterium]|nr:MAG: hypothetical protein EOO38_09755 [Cytophagaceae bacterium]
MKTFPDCRLISRIATGAYYKADDLNRRMHMDIVSYVCAHRNNVTLRKGIGNTGAICGGLRYAWWAVLLVSSVEMLALATVGWGTMVAKRKGTYAKL